MGGGYFTKLLTKDVREINKVFLSLFCMGIIVIAIYTSINLTKSSYALFSDTIKGEKTIEVEIDLGLDKSGANPPVLDTNMIPVYYDETAKVWKKADSSNKRRAYKWYDYDNKMWANSVTVSSTNREKYKEAKLGTEIPMDDILTMQVWVPRYKYKVWNYNSDGVTYSNPKEIEIVFENGTERTGDIECTDTIIKTSGSKSESCKINGVECTDSTCNNKYYTHPAFWKDKNSNSIHDNNEEIEGFWIGKFETTGSISNITIKPNITPLLNQTVGNFYNAFLEMNDSGNIYGFNTNTDTHMIKNMEWGAIAYLSHSKYGTCTNGQCHEVGINNKGNYNSSTYISSGTITGCGDKPGSPSSSTCNSYDTKLGMGASTTGNIYGVYDMSGANFEFVSASMIKSDGNFIAPPGISYGLSKIYHDYYSYGTTDTDSIAIKRGKLGDATKESINWYDDYSKQVYISGFWMSRSLLHDDKFSAGVFAYQRIATDAASLVSSRLAINF